jgi:hypothetical protein
MKDPSEKEKKKNQKEGYLTIDKIQKLKDENKLDEYLSKNYDLEKYKNKYDINDVMFSMKITINSAFKILTFKKYDRNRILQECLIKSTYYKLINDIYVDALNDPELKINIKNIVIGYFNKHKNELKMNDVKEFSQYIEKIKNE